MPLYEYEHMEEWAAVKRHVSDEITLLCDQHHREKTAGLLSKKTVSEANANPLNLQIGISKPYDLHFAGREAEIEIGTNSFTCEDIGYGTAMIPLSIDDTPLIMFLLEDGHLLLHLLVFDEFNRPVLCISNNHLFYSIQPWDIQLVGRVLTIREQHRKILIEIEFCPPGKVKILRGRFLRNGVEVLVRPENILITNNAFVVRGNRVHNCLGGLIIGHHEQRISGFMTVSGVSRYLGDRKEALRFEKEAMQVSL